MPFFKSKNQSVIEMENFTNQFAEIARNKIFHFIRVNIEFEKFIFTIQ